MRTACASRLSTNSLDRLVDWFIPAQYRGGSRSAKQARMFLYSHLFGPFIGNTVPLALYSVRPDARLQVAVLVGVDHRLLDLSVRPARRRPLQHAGFWSRSRT